MEGMIIQSISAIIDEIPQENQTTKLDDFLQGSHHPSLVSCGSERTLRINATMMQDAPGLWLLLQIPFELIATIVGILRTMQFLLFPLLLPTVTHVTTPPYVRHPTVYTSSTQLIGPLDIDIVARDWGSKPLLVLTNHGWVSRAGPPGGTSILVC
jgi:hypothetical protein